MVEYRKTEWDRIHNPENSVEASNPNITVETYTSSIDSSNSQQNSQSDFQQRQTSSWTERARTFDDVEDNQQAQPVVAKQKETSFWKKLLLTATLGAVLGVFVFIGSQVAGNVWSQYSGADNNKVGAYYLQAKTVESSAERTTPNTISDIYKQISPNVVSITNEIEVENPFYGKQTQVGSGTGVVFNINEDSVLIVTNNHVIEGAEKLAVSFDGQVDYEGKLVGYDAESDIAVVKVVKSELPAEILDGLSPIVMADSDKVEVGQMAVAIGNPLGYNDTLTVGYISGIDRKIGSGIESHTDLIQTDAAINPGNSGGALLNLKGELIGINTIKIINTSGPNDSEGFDPFGSFMPPMQTAGVSVDNMGFAVPVNTVKSVIKDILAQGYVSKPYIGVSGETITAQIAKRYNLSQGFLVREVVPNSGAEAAGVSVGDIITAIDGQAVTSFEDLIAHLREKSVGDKLSISVDRRGQILNLEVELKEKVNKANNE